MTYVWKPREDGISFRESAHENNVCGKSATGDYICTRPKGHTGWHVASGSDGAYEAWPDGVFVPVPDGVAYDDALRAVNDTRPWVEMAEAEVPLNARVREEYRAWQDEATAVRFFVHPDDVPDPDADLIERMAKAMWDQRSCTTTWEQIRDDEQGQKWLRDARAALAVIREDGAR